MNARELYQSAIMEHARAPRHAAMPESIGAPVRRNNPLCGDRVDVGVRVEGGAVADIGVVVRGCALCVAAGSLMSERVLGAELGAVRALAERLSNALDPGGDLGGLGGLEVLAGVQQFPSRKSCAMLPWEALLEAIE